MDIDFSFSVQQMAKSGNSKVIFVPMQLQSDVVSQLASGSGGGSSSMGAMIANEGGDGMSSLGGAGKVGLLNSIADV